MRFRKTDRIAFMDTARKRAAALRRQRQDREALPLLSEIVAEDQPDIDTLMRDRALHWKAREQAQRDRRAAEWREARARLRAYPPVERRAILDYWNGCKWPADPVYLKSMMHMYDNDRIEHLRKVAVIADVLGEEAA